MSNSEIAVDSVITNKYADISLCAENIIHKATVEHDHGFFEIVVPLSSAFKAVLNGNKIEFCEGEILIFGSQCEYSFLAESGKIIRLIFSQKTAVCLCGFLNFESFPDVMRSPISAAKSAMIESAANSSPEPIVLKKLLFETVYDCVTLKKCSVTRKTEIPAWLSDTVEKMKINKNYTKGVPKMVELSGKTPEHLSRSMKKYYKISPTDYINELRMKNVSRQLLETNEPVVDICYENGYQNMSWFNTLFKQTFLLTPSKFREKYGNPIK